MKDTPFVTRAYNLGLKVVPNFVGLSLEQIEYYEKNLDQISVALARGFVVEKPEPELAHEPSLDCIIKVDRSVKPVYEKWVKRVMHSELELTGPTEYDLRTLELSMSHNQKIGITSGHIIYDELKKDNLLEDCLGLTDLLSIRAKGIKVFREFFAGKAVFAWKSVVKNQGANLHVPFLIESRGRVTLGWRCLDYGWSFNSPALRFRK